MFKVVDHFGNDAEQSETDYLCNGDSDNSQSRLFFRIVEA